jgi:hypothetical protein
MPKQHHNKVLQRRSGSEGKDKKQRGFFPPLKIRAHCTGWRAERSSLGAREAEAAELARANGVCCTSGFAGRRDAMASPDCLVHSSGSSRPWTRTLNHATSFMPVGLSRPPAPAQHRPPPGPVPSTPPLPAPLWRRVLTRAR